MSIFIVIAGLQEAMRSSNDEGKKPNIAIVILDTLRYDAFKRHFDWLSGRRYSNAYSTSHQSIPSHASLFTGFYPSEIGVHVKSPKLDCTQLTLAEKLQTAGYSTYGFHENGHLAHWDGWSRGFGEFLGREGLKKPHSKNTRWNDIFDDNKLSAPLEYLHGIYRFLRKDTKTIDSFRNCMRRYQDLDFLNIRIKSKNIDSPTFLFVNLMDAHQPYSAPDGHFSFEDPVSVDPINTFLGTEHDQSKIHQAYDEGVAYLSRRYNTIFKYLDRNFDYIVTAADHGESLGEHGVWTHDLGIHPENTHIPLVITGQDVLEKTIGTPVSLLDVHGTVCEMAGISNDSRGQDLRNPIDSQPRLTEYHGTQPWQFPKFSDNNIPEKYEEQDVQLDGILGDGFYGYETVDGFQSIGKSPWDDAQKKLTEVRAKIPRKEQDESWIGIEEVVNEFFPEDTRKRLKHLGYI